MPSPLSINPPPVSGTHNLFAVSVSSLVLDILRKWNNTICDLLGFLLGIFFVRFLHIVARIKSSFLFYG
jgi:hypothetical protein